MKSALRIVSCDAGVSGSAERVLAGNTVVWSAVVAKLADCGRRGADRG
jgi:hypothetical protein